MSSFTQPRQQPGVKQAEGQLAAAALRRQEVRKALELRHLLIITEGNERLHKNYDTKRADLRASAVVGIYASNVGRTEHAKGVNSLIDINALRSSYDLLSAETGSQTEFAFSGRSLEVSVDVNAAKALLVLSIGGTEEAKRTYELLKAHGRTDGNGLYYKRLTPNGASGDAETTILIAILAKRLEYSEDSERLLKALLSTLPKNELGLYFDHLPEESKSNSDIRTSMMLAALLNKMGMVEDSRKLFGIARAEGKQDDLDGKPRLYLRRHGSFASQDVETTAWAGILLCSIPSE